MTVQHLDLYRLDEIGDDDALALEEYVRDDAVTLVEWPQAGIGRLGTGELGDPDGPRDPWTSAPSRSEALHGRRARALEGGGRP